MGATDQAIERIVSQISDGTLPRGARVPPEPEFSAELGVSRNAYREAVKALEVAGVRAIRHRTS